MYCIVHFCMYVFQADWKICPSLQWRHNERHGVSNHRRLDCLLSRLFRRTSKKTSKLRATGLCGGNPPVTGGFPSQRASNAENVSIWCRHYDHGILRREHPNLWGISLKVFPMKPLPNCICFAHIISSQPIHVSHLPFRSALLVLARSNYYPYTSDRFLNS